MTDSIISDFETSIIKKSKKEKKARIKKSPNTLEQEKGESSEITFLDESNLSKSKKKRKLQFSDDEEEVFKSSTKKSKKSASSKTIKADPAKIHENSNTIKPNNKEISKKEKTDLEIQAKSTNDTKKPRKRKNAALQEEDVWKWWEEVPHPDGINWETLEHNGPYFAPLYEPLPPDVKFYYNDKPFKLSIESEEVTTFYAKLFDHEYTTKEIFNNNFFSDWRDIMTPEEKKIIVDFKKCNFKEITSFFEKQREERRGMSKEEKNKIKEANAEISEKYGVCYVDGHKQKVGNFRIEPPGLFRGRGDHPKQGRLKTRVQPEDVTLNLSKSAKIPDPPIGHKWKNVIHDNKVTWLAHWIENISGSYKYVMLNATARTKGAKDMGKYDIARGLHNCINSIRTNYLADMSSKEMKTRQRAVALYFIDRLALRAGHEKEDGESADTVGCCSLRVEHIKLQCDKEKKEYTVDFDFLGKDSVRYVNHVAVGKKVYKNLKLFMKNKNGEDDLFDRLTTSSLNKYLGELMEGLSAKVFRTYNASTTLQEELNKFTEDKMTVNDKLLAYNRANRAVAILCNHQRAIPKTFDTSMANLNEKIKKKKTDVKAIKAEIKSLKSSKALDAKIELKRNQLKRLKEQYHKLKLSVTDKEENKDVALGTSKLNYLDPRISVSWCKRHNVPIEKIYNKTQREKFQWALDMTDSDFIF